MYGSKKWSHIAPTHVTSPEQDAERNPQSWWCPFISPTFQGRPWPDLRDSNPRFPKDGVSNIYRSGYLNFCLPLRSHFWWPWACSVQAVACWSRSSWLSLREGVVPPGPLGSPQFCHWPGLTTQELVTLVSFFHLLIPISVSLCFWPPWVFCVTQ